MKILRPTSEEERAFLYKDVEELITTGFLTQKLYVKDHTLNLRSLNRTDQILLYERINFKRKNDPKIWTVANSIWMMNGDMHLTNDLKPVFDQVKKLPQALLDYLYDQTRILYARTTQAMKRAEAFCYEARSRSLWEGIKGQSIDKLTPFNLPINPIQHFWISLNSNEDLRLEDERQWSGFKLVASALDSKGVRKLDNKDKHRREREEERRQFIQDQTFYAAFGIDLKEQKIEGYLAPKSDDDLAEEYERWLKGDQDEHDKIVEEYKNSIKQAHVRRVEEARERMEQMNELDGIFSSSQALTPEQAEALLRLRD